ncbi:Dual specificity phosphatase, catalytic domain [Polystyrenella longa]|uniref:Dual specificity phosphatase, catalytic domain n=1 Tax=Polystyrenella longa TaxID=2528007 RepID=A0A518CRU5_9PLAN|nr:dual specificity protein phosphatase family protein [Polystyrenella longa]QDU81951.1 Dual specificity phosphatase, catalytic domain [Polystyrenella longa]
MSSNSKPAQTIPEKQTWTQHYFSRKRLIIFGSILVLIAGGVIWDECFKYQYFAKRFGTVVPGELYRSGQISDAMFTPTVKKYDIKVVIDLTGYDYTDPYQVNEVEASKELGVEHCRMRLDGDGRGDIQHYADAIEKIIESQQNNEPVLIHCAAGAHRTGGIVACYRMLFEEMSADEAYAEMCSYGLGGGIEGRLPTYINEHIEELAVELHGRGILKTMPATLPQIGKDPLTIQEKQEHAENDSSRSTASI